MQIGIKEEKGAGRGRSFRKKKAEGGKGNAEKEEGREGRRRGTRERR